MARRVSAVLLAWVLGCGLSALGGGKVERTDRYRRDHLIVKLRAGAGVARLRALATGLRGRAVHRFRSSGAALIKLDAGVDVDAVIAAVRARPDVAWAERDHYLHISGTVPNDPDFESCWGLDNSGQFLGTPDADIDAPEAWDIATGSSDVVVAVIDTGVDYTHEDLAANMWTNAAELNGQPNVDDDDNGFIDDVHGIAVFEGAKSGDPMDLHGHGTHVAGIIGAAGNNARGMVGVCWTVRIMALRFTDEKGYGLESDAVTCIEYAVAHGAKVLNNSYGGRTWSEVEYQAIVAANDAGVLFCASAGNDSADNDGWPSYPASYDLPNVIAVASTGGSDNISYFSNYGASSVDVGAPGESVWSTWPGNQYQLLDGTSMACPFVVGVAALVLAANPGMTMTELRDRVLWTGDPLFDLRETTVTGLRVNAYNALAGIYAARITTPSPLPSATESLNYSKQLEAEGMGGTFAWSWAEPTYVEREVGNGFVAAGTAKTWQADEGMWELDLNTAFPTDFPFYGTRYSRVWVCSNGYLQFAETPPSPDEMAEVPRMANKKMIAVYWCDLTTAGDILNPLDVHVWQPDATSLAIRWQAEQAGWLLGFKINVSVVLHADGRIDMHYGACEQTIVGGVVGVSSGDGTHYRASTSKTGSLDVGWAPSSIWVAGHLPPGLTLHPDGAVGGIPTTPGTYCFDVTAEDGAGGVDTKGFALKVYPAGGPQADLEAAPLRGTQPLDVQFSDLSDGTVTDWHWEFGDGATSDQESPSHTYDDPGQYTVVLTVTGPGGSDTMTELRYIEVLAAGLPCDFEGTPTLGTAPLAVHFDYIPNPELDPLVWVWYFSDGQYRESYAPTLDYTFEQPGDYDVILVAMDAMLQYGSCTKLLYVTALPPAGNNPPEADDDEATMIENCGPTDIDVLDNDDDLDGDPLTITEVIGAAHGVVANHATHLTYTPNPDFAGQDSVRYEVSDGRGGFDHADVAITVTFINDPPVLIAPLPDIVADEDDGPTVIDLANHFDDPDLPAGDILTASVSLATAGVGDVVGLVDEATYTDYLDNWLYTHDGDNRGPSGAEHDLARDNVQALLGGFGLAADLDPFVYNSNTWHNVVAVQPGVTRPDDVYLVGAHYDSVSNPGADDNASGVAGVLEAARVLSRFDFEASLVFVAFDMEETGLHGSRAYAQEHTDDNILGMVSLDMIAYNPAGSYHDQVAVYQHDQTGPITGHLDTAFATYAGGVTVSYQGLMGSSDHQPFEDEGFDAALVIERAHGSNPYYHKPGDSMDTADYIDPVFATHVTAGTVGYLATHATLADDPDLLTPAINGLTLTLHYGPDQHGAQIVTLRVTDLAGEYAEDSFLVTVRPVEDPPRPLDDIASVDEDSLASPIDVLVNDDEPDGDPITLDAIAVQADHGHAEIDGSQIAYTPDAGFWGTDTFDYEVSDNHGNSATATVTVTVVPSSPPQPPGDLDCHDQAYDGHTLNVDGPAPRSLGIQSIGAGANPETVLIAIRIGPGTSDTWLRPMPDPDHLEPTGSEAQADWRTPADWQNVRLRRLQPATTYDFYAVARNAAGQTTPTNVGTATTNQQGDVDANGGTTAHDFAHVKHGILRGGTVGDTQPWPCDLDDSATLDGADLGIVLTHAHP